MEIRFTMDQSTGIDKAFNWMTQVVRLALETTAKNFVTRDGLFHISD